MADLDIFNDVTPKLQYSRPSAPLISAMKTALAAYNGTSYSALTMRTMSERDLAYACRLHGLSVPGL